MLTISSNLTLRKSAVCASVMPVTIQYFNSSVTFIVTQGHTEDIFLTAHHLSIPSKYMAPLNFKNKQFFLLQKE